MLTVIQHPGEWSPNCGRLDTAGAAPPSEARKDSQLGRNAWQLGVPAENAAQYAIFVRMSLDICRERPCLRLESQHPRQGERTHEGRVRDEYSTGRVIAAATQRVDFLGLKAEGYRGSESPSVMQRHYWPPETLLRMLW